MNLVQLELAQKDGSERTGPPSVRPASRKPSKKTFDPAGPLFAPPMRVEPMAGGHLLLDTDNANWVAVNPLGYSVLQQIGNRPGLRLEEMGNCGVDEAVAAKFISRASKREFIFNTPLPDEPYLGRAQFLGLDRLHEFWFVPNYDCNLRCRHCYTIEQVMHNPHVLSHEAIQRIYEEAKQLGAEIFYLTGGEVMQHPEILEIVKTIASQRKLILFTNGMLITPPIAERLAEFRERLIVQVSIEGHDEAHNALIRGKGAFGQAMQGIRNLLRAGVRVGVSSTPTKATKDSIPQLTQLLCELEESGSRAEYHHLIMLLDIGGTKKNPERTLLTHEEFSHVLDGCIEAAHLGRKNGSRMKVANEKIMHACASNGPKKDFCGAGYTILGVDPEGNLKTCAATINDNRFNLGRMLDSEGNYLEGSLEQLWREGKRARWVRNFTVARRPGERLDDLRFFHGGACWYNMPNPERPLSEGHPFYETLEEHTLKAIRQEAEKRARVPRKDIPAVLSYMHRSRIACAGSRKTIDHSERGLDHGYCICFA